MFKREAAARRIRKRSFLLFELLISLALITLCLFPLIQPLAAMRKEEYKYLEEIQLERIAQNAFCELKTILYENKTHRWEQLASEVSAQLPNPFYIAAGMNLDRAYHCNYTLKHRDDARKPSLKKIGRVIDVDLNLTSGTITHSFHHTLFLEKLEE